MYYKLKRLGIIKNALYVAFGYGEQIYLQQSSIALNEYNQLVNKMRDYRDPITRK